MKKFTDLFLFEINRIKKAYFVLVGSIVLLQIASVIFARNNYMNIFRNYQKETRGSVYDFLDYNGKFDFFQVQSHILFEFSIMLGVFALVLYAFVIWYRDWIGKNNLSYRLLTLPGSRMSIFYAKLACILFLMGGLLAIQVVMLSVGERLIGFIMPSEIYEATQFLGQTSKGEVVSYILPSRILDFVLHYTVGVTVLVVVKLTIILRLSYKWKGLVSGIALAGVLVFMVIAFLMSDWVLYIFPLETLVLTISFCVLITGAALVAIHYLMKNKISV